jgi:hypothetical protein
LTESLTSTSDGRRRDFLFVPPLGGAFPRSNCRLTSYRNLPSGRVDSTVALADVVIMKSGDRITGAVVSADSGKLVIAPAFDKTATIPLDDVATFSTDPPGKLKRKDGSIIDQAVAQGAAGEVVPAAVTGTLQHLS